MPGKRIQHRRAIGLRFPTYYAVTDIAEENKTSRSGVIDKLINDYLDKEGAPHVHPFWLK